MKRVLSFGTLLGLLLPLVPAQAMSQCLACGLSNMGNSLNSLGSMLMQQELQKEHDEEVLEQQHEQQLQEMQRQHDLETQRLREPQQLLNAQQTSAAEMNHLVAMCPNWRTVVGVPPTNATQPDLNVPFRRWLSSKPADYQSLINSTQSASIIEDAITLFLTETRGAESGECKP